MKERFVSHLDMDAFFASVEQMSNPHLIGQPVIVSGDPDGRSVVSTCSYEARPYGVRSGMPLREAFRKCPGAIVIQGNPEKYIHISAGILKILQKYTPFVEPFSIDEAFYELWDVDSWEEAGRIAQTIKKEIGQAFHLTGSIGIAKNKLLAKLASDLEKPDSLTMIRETDIDPLFQRLPIRDLWGVGEKAEAAMHRIGVKTIWDLRQYTEQKLQEYFGAVGTYFYHACRGWDDTPLVYTFQEAEMKSMGNEYTLFRDSRRREQLLGILRFLVQKVSRRLRKAKRKGRTITVKIRFEPFQTITRAQTLPMECDSEEMIYREAQELFLKNWDGVRKIRLLGVSVSHLRKTGDWVQTHLLDDPTTLHKDRLTLAKDRIQDVYGESILTWGSILASKGV